MIPFSLPKPASSNCEDAASACRVLALTAVNMPRTELDRIALQTDAPDWRDVEAADCLVVAHQLLVRSVAP